jgi:hypothetical protein
VQVPTKKITSAHKPKTKLEEIIQQAKKNEEAIRKNQASIRKMLNKNNEANIDDIEEPFHNLSHRSIDRMAGGHSMANKGLANLNELLNNYDR